MHYIRLRSTGEVLGAALSDQPDEDWIARYATSLGATTEGIEVFEAPADPRPLDARTEPSPPPPSQPFNVQSVMLHARLRALEEGN